MAFATIDEFCARLARELGMPTLAPATIRSWRRGGCPAPNASGAPFTDDQLTAVIGWRREHLQPVRVSMPGVGNDGGARWALEIRRLQEEIRRLSLLNRRHENCHLDAEQVTRELRESVESLRTALCDGSLPGQIYDISKHEERLIAIERNRQAVIDCVNQWVIDWETQNAK